MSQDMRTGEGEAVETEKRATTGAEIGTTGLQMWGGIVDEELLTGLRGERGRRIYREMAANDPTVGAILNAVGLLLAAVDWTFTANENAPSQEAAEDEAKFAESLFADMSHTWDDFISECLSMLVFGWSYFEIVLKRRVGPLESDPAKRSDYEDGRIGIRKLAIRAQETFSRWGFDDDGGITGMWQSDPSAIGRGNEVFIPIEKALLFRTVSSKNNPEGRSILRNAYRPWYFGKRIQEIEAIGIERELAGLPVVSIPAATFTDPTQAQQLGDFKRLARDLRFNSQAGVVISSDCWLDAEGSPTANRKVIVELLKTGGARTIDTVAVKQDYKRDIARSVLADFLMLGFDKGAFNLAESKNTLFFRACTTILWRVQAVLQRFLLPRIWDYNGLDRALMPTAKPGALAPADIEALGNFLAKLAQAGDMIFPDPDLENYIRREADLPEKTDDTRALQDQSKQDEAEIAAAARAAVMGAGRAAGAGGKEGAAKPAGASKPKEPA